MHIWFIIKSFYRTKYCSSFFNIENQLPGQLLKVWFKHQLLSFTPLDLFSFPFKYHYIPHTELLCFLSFIPLFLHFYISVCSSHLKSCALVSHVFMADGFTPSVVINFEQSVFRLTGISMSFQYPRLCIPFISYQSPSVYGSSLPVKS